MVSVPDWTTDGYTFQGDSQDAERRERRLSVRALMRRTQDWFRRVVRRSQPAPPVSKSLVYALCEEYRHFDLWTAYHTFRLDPRARTWQRLRRRSVPWQSEQTVEGLLNRLYPWNGKGTPDPNTVGLALITVTSAAALSKKKR